VAALMDDESGRQAMGRAGRAWVEAEFSWQACAERLEAGLTDAKGEGA